MKLYHVQNFQLLLVVHRTHQYEHSNHVKQEKQERHHRIQQVDCKQDYLVRQDYSNIYLVEKLNFIKRKNSRTN